MRGNTTITFVATIVIPTKEINKMFKLTTIAKTMIVLAIWGS